MTNQVVFEATEIIHPETRQSEMHFKIRHRLMIEGRPRLKKKIVVCQMFRTRGLGRVKTTCSITQPFVAVALQQDPNVITILGRDSRHIEVSAATRLVWRSRTKKTVFKLFVAALSHQTGRQRSSRVIYILPTLGKNTGLEPMTELISWNLEAWERLGEIHSTSFSGRLDLDCGCG